MSGGPAALVSARGLSKRFDVSAPWLARLIKRQPRLWVHAVSDVDLEIYKGETLALVGESGCGKSTLARLLVGLYAPSAGDIFFEGQNLNQALNAAQGQALRRRMQMIFQDPYASLNPRWRVQEIVSEPMRVHQTPPDMPAQTRRVQALLESVGLNGRDASKFPHQFSGGQRQRISIARALAVSPEFLVCDEPTSALDVSVQAQVLNLMQDLQASLGLTYLFISHNLAVVRHVSDRVGVMYLGRLVELAPTRQLFAEPRHPYTRMLLAAIPKLKKSGANRMPIQGEVPNPLNPPSGCAFHPRCPKATALCQKETPVLRAFEGIQIACHHMQG